MRAVFTSYGRGWKIVLTLITVAAGLLVGATGALAEGAFAGLNGAVLAGNTSAFYQDPDRNFIADAYSQAYTWVDHETWVE